MGTDIEIKNNEMAQPCLLWEALGAATDQATFANHLSCRSSNTIRRQADDLVCFARFLEALARRARQDVQIGDLQHDPGAWRSGWNG